MAARVALDAAAAAGWVPVGVAGGVVMAVDTGRLAVAVPSVGVLDRGDLFEVVRVDAGPVGAGGRVAVGYGVLWQVWSRVLPAAMGPTNSV